MNHCLCCKSDKDEVIRKKCPCWVMHFHKCPWNEQPPDKEKVK